MAPACEDCKAPLVWAKRDDDKWVPFDAVPVVAREKGLSIYRLYQFNGELRADRVRLKNLFGSRYTLHLDTCPERKDDTP